MGNPNLIEVTGETSKQVKVDKFSKSVSIYKCNGDRKAKAPASIDVVGKCNSVLIDNCSYLEVSLDSVMATCEVSNCQRVKIIMKEGAKVMSVVIDKTDGAQIMVSDASNTEDFQVIAAKFSEVNVVVNHKGEVMEKPIPEQFVFKIDCSGDAPKVTSDVSDLYKSS